MTQEHAIAAIKTLQQLGYTWLGGELWKPPLRTAPAQQGDPIYQYQRANGTWIDQDKSSYDYNVLYAPDAIVRVVYTAAPAPQAQDALQDIAAYIGVGGYNGATTEQLSERIRVEFDRLSAMQSAQPVAAQPVMVPLTFPDGAVLSALNATGDGPWGEQDYADMRASLIAGTHHITAQKVLPPEQAAALDVLAERTRQISTEGWTPEHDDEHGDGGLARAAACYALHTVPVGNVGDYLRFWPWDSEWWKPGAPRRNLIKAGALILAEIERLDRAAIGEAMQ